MDHHRQIEGRGRFLRASQPLEIVGPGNVVRQSRFDANHDIAMACDSSARQIENDTIDIHQLAIWGTAGARDVDNDATDLRRCPGHGSELIPADPQSAQPVTPSCRQNRAPSVTRAAWVWMSIKPRGDDLAACIDGI